MKRNDPGTRRRHRQGWIVYSGSGSWEYEHRLVMESHLRRRLRTGERIKHRNGDNYDNRLENLAIEVHPKVNPWIDCACGCGLRLRKYGSNGSTRRFVAGHAVRARRRGRP